MMTSRHRGLLVSAALAATALLLSCGGGGTAAKPAIPLVDVFDSATVTGGKEASESKPKWLWNFSAEGGAPSLGWKAAKGISGLTHADGVLKGRTTSADSVLWVKIDNPGDPSDGVHHFELRMKVDKAGKAGVTGVREGADPAKENPALWWARQDVEAGDEVATVRIQLGIGLPTPAAGVIAISPVDQADAEFEIESFRLVSQAEQRAETPTGVSWQGLASIFRESITARAPESFTVDVDVPANAWLDLNVGTADEGAVGFRVENVTGGASGVLLERTVTTPQRWEVAPIDLAGVSGTATLKFSLESDVESALGFWGSPTIRVHGGKAATVRPAGEGLGGIQAPQSVVLIVLDTLRRDRLSFYGHDRDNAPNMARMVSQGALFKDNISQATWTKVSVTSLVTSMYPVSHRVHQFTDRLTAQATTLAEVYREAGYATVSFATNPFTGRATNLHQGYEELHEGSGFHDPRYEAKTAREAVNRAVSWLDGHSDTPFFMYLHVVDPHSPFEPRAPYDKVWADPSKREERMAEWEKIKKHIKNPFFISQAVAARAEVEAAGVDPETYLNYQKDWYDGSILGMDAEIGRFVERLESLGLGDDVVIAVVADHGEEFQEHGQMFHGQTAYGELANVPLFLYGPGRIPAGVEVEQTTRTIDLMPTLLALSGLETPEDAQGQSLLPLIAAAKSGSEPDPSAWEERPAVTEKAGEPGDGPDDTQAHESYGLVLDGWKFVHNPVRPEGRPEYELFDHRQDPLNLSNVAEQNPDQLEKLKAELEMWRSTAEQSKLPLAKEAPEDLPAEELERLRNLGYIQ